MDGSSADPIAEIAGLLDRVPADLAVLYVDAVRRGAAADRAEVWLVPDDRAAASGAVTADGIAFDGAVPVAARRWLAELAGPVDLADPGAAMPGGDPGAPALLAAGRTAGAAFAVVALGADGPADPARRALFLCLARFAPAVLRAAGLPPPVAAADAVVAERDAARLRQFGNASPDVFWIRDSATLTTEYVSPAFEAIYGLSLAEIQGEDGFARWSERIVAEDFAAATASMERARGGEVSLVEFRIRRAPEGQVRWIRATDFPLRSADGVIERVGRISRDITDAKLAAEESRNLQLELQHRVRNALAVIRALVRRTVAASESVEDLASHLDGRINAFARVQAALARNPKAGLDLEHLVADELLANAAHERDRVVIKGPRISLTPKAAETLGLILHELATNAVEHGALGPPKGRIRVVWMVRPDHDVPRLVLEWSERGAPAPAEGPARRGFGTELLERTLPYELNGSATVSYERQGVRCVLEVPLTGLVLSGTG